MKIQPEFRKHFEMACRSQGTVLILGETGTGKSTLAKMIHEQSSRSSGPFITINLATLHEGTLEAELFGYEKGAFTGAGQRRFGLLELAQGGTVFLDEVGELPLRLQARLLEFLQSRSIRPLGGKSEIQLDVRVIAATHRNLSEEVRKGEFREDLFHRMRVLPIFLRPLREQVDEMDTWVHAFLSEITENLQKKIHRLSPEVAERLEWYDWPGNLRELRSALEYAVLAAEGSEIFLNHLPDWILDESQGSSQGFTPGFNKMREMREMRGGGSPNPSDSSLLSQSSIPPNFWGVQEGRIQENHSNALSGEIPSLPEGRDLPRLDDGFGRLDLPLFWSYRKTRETFEKEFFRRALIHQGGRITQTARKIGLNKATLSRRMKDYCLQSSSICGSDLSS